MDSLIKDIGSLLKRSQNILLVAHVDPDLDAAGALLALAHTLRDQQKQAVALLTGDIPSAIHALCPEDAFTTAWPDQFNPDAVVVLDTASLDRINKDVKDKLQGSSHSRVVNIDHHLTNTKFGDFNLVRSSASSSCEIVFELIKDMKGKITPPSASLLLAGIVTDTGRFRHDSTTANTLRVATALIEHGANLFHINEILEKVFSLQGIHLWGTLLQRARSILDGKVIWLDVALAEAQAEDTDIGGELYSFFLRARGSHLVVVFTEKPDTQVYISLRSSPSIDCTLIARHFGGGGHARAAGCTISGTPAEVRPKVLEYISDSFQQMYAEPSE